MKGMFLQGAGWDKKNACLLEAEPMQLVCNIPSIHFKPVEARRRALKGELGFHYSDVVFPARETLTVPFSVQAQ